MQYNPSRNLLESYMSVDIKLSPERAAPAKNMSHLILDQ